MPRSEPLLRLVTLAAIEVGMFDLAAVDGIVGRHGSDRGRLLQILVEVQETLRGVPPDVQAHLATRLDLTLGEVKGVVGFYSFLSEGPSGAYTIHLSDGVTDRMAGGREVAAALSAALRVDVGAVRADGRVGLFDTSCTGMADHGPAGLVNGRPLVRLGAGQAPAIAALVDAGTPVDAWPDDWFAVDTRVWRTDRVLDAAIAPGDALRAALARGADGTLAEIAASGLRGCGGSGFPTARKWAAARSAPGAERYVVCNADEGEPGTFKDRFLLTSHLDRVIEGMAVCGYVIGARHGLLYLRYEYRWMREAADAALQRWAGILPDLGLEFHLEVHWGAGAYICGMETALLESLEGKRGVPRTKIPFPVVAGYRGAPTVVNNVETFATAAAIVVQGGAWFAEVGTEKSPGTKLFCVAGDCARPGIYEYPYGVPLRTILEDAGADPAAVQVGGPSGRLVPPGEFDRTLAWEDLPSVGTITAFGAGRDLFEIVHNHVAFFRHESCGLCTPCRVGTSMLASLVDKLATTGGSAVDLAHAEALSKLMRAAAHCGLGQTASNPVMDLIRGFPDVLGVRTRHTDPTPAFDLDDALREARALTGRDDADAHLDDT